MLLGGSCRTAQDDDQTQEDHEDNGKRNRDRTRGAQRIPAPNTPVHTGQHLRWLGYERPPPRPQSKGGAGTAADNAVLREVDPHPIEAALVTDDERSVLKRKKMDAVTTGATTDHWATSVARVYRGSHYSNGAKKTKVVYSADHPPAYDHSLRAKIEEAF